jgi:hypothetical protein
MGKNFIFLLMAIFITSSVCALGVSPGRTTINFEPGLVRNVNFELANSGSEDLKVILSAQGDLSKYIRLSSPVVTLPAGEAFVSASYVLNLPESMSPGLHTGEILIVEVPNTAGSGQSGVLATLAVVSQVHVNVPYPGKYATAELVIYNVNVGEDTAFIFPVKSEGEFDLISVRANVDIYNSIGMKVDSFNTEIISVPSGEKREIVHNWKAEVPIGNYRAVASVVYDDGTISLEETFSVGSKELELQEISVNKFSLGEIVKLEMLVENKWSESISDAYIKTRILNEKGATVSSFESAVHDVDELSKESFISYWDTAGVKAGDYQAEVSINYAGKSSMKDLKFEVGEGELRIIGLGYVISSEGKGEMSGLIMILITIIIVLILINLLWFFVIRKMLHK